ncbi:MFS transporter [Nonomuraea lactucae]|uniref:MFS transporter n=1 Tax=Nonomuraea lactucae TaxID=2249762 RepID=UPI0013B435A2|nr:MFS transporter [Nonomuraea lactucae]
MLVGLFGYSALETAISPALPAMMTFFGTSPDGIAWAFTALLLVGAVATPLVGRMSDLADKRWVMVGVLTVTTLGVVIAATAQSVVLFTIGQGLQGVGLALVPLSVALVSDLFTPQSAKAGNGLIIAVGTVSTALGLLIAGPVLTLTPFQGLYWIALVFLVPALIAALFIPRTAGRESSARTIDAFGGFLLAIGLGGVMLAISGGKLWGLGSVPQLITAVVALGALAWFVGHERRVAEPLVDVGLMRTAPIAAACMVSFGIGFSTFAAFVILPILVELPVDAGGLGGTATTTGLYLLPLGVAGVVAAPLVGALERAVGSRVSMLIGTGAILAGALVLTVGHRNSWANVTSMVLVGIGIAVALTQMLNIAVTAAPADRRASVSGLAFVVKGVGGALGSLVGATVIGATEYSPTGFVVAFAIGAGVALLTMAAAVLLPARVHEAVQSAGQPAGSAA